MSSTAFEELERDFLNLQAMMAVLLVTTGPVVVKKEELQKLNLEGASISIEEDAAADTFTFRVTEEV